MHLINVFVRVLRKKPPLMPRAQKRPQKFFTDSRGRPSHHSFLFLPFSLSVDIDAKMYIHYSIILDIYYSIILS